MTYKKRVKLKAEKEGWEASGMGLMHAHFGTNLYLANVNVTFTQAKRPTYISWAMKCVIAFRETFTSLPDGGCAQKSRYLFGQAVSQL